MLYTKLNCPLCDEAYLMLLELTNEIPLEIDIVDITHEYNKNIQPTYAKRIPVLACDQVETELDWPFTPEKVRAYLSA